MNETEKKGRKNLLAMLLILVIVAGFMGTSVGPETVSAATSAPGGVSETTSAAGALSLAASAPGGKLTLGKAYTMTFTEPDAYTAYDLKLPDSGRLTMSLDIVSGEGAEYTFSVYDTEDNAVIGCDLFEPNGHKKEAFDLVGGDYVMIINGRNTVGTVSFKLDFASAKETYPDTITKKNDSVDTASKLSLNKEITGQFAVNDDRDYYSFSISKNNKLTLTLSTKDVESINVSLMDRTGDLIWNQEGVSKGKKTWDIAIEKGDYFLSIRNNDVNTHTGIYKLKTKYSSKLETLPKIQLKTVKNVSDKSLKLTWKKVINVSGYEVQISKDKKFKNHVESGKIPDSTMASTTFFGLDKKKIYYIRVRCFNEYLSGKTVYGKWSKTGKAKIKK